MVINRILLCAVLAGSCLAQEERPVILPDDVPESFPLGTAEGMSLVRMQDFGTTEPGPEFREAYTFLSDKERRGQQHSPADGKLIFHVTRPGLVYLSVTWIPGGNASGDWKSEVTSRNELMQTWSEVGPCPLAPDTNMLYSKECKAGEVIALRTSKYSPPRPILAVRKVALAEPESFADVELRVVGDNIVCRAESDFSKSVRELSTLGRTASRAVTPLRNLNRQKSDLQMQISQARTQLVGFNTQLAGVTSVAANNRLVGAINTLEGQIELALEKLDAYDQQIAAARAEMNRARESYVQSVLECRKQADRLSAVYEHAMNDQQLQDRIRMLSAEAGEPLTFSSSGAFRASLKRLATYEQKIQTNSVPLRVDGRSYYVPVVIDGKHSEEMVVDSGATVMALPHRTAEKMGLRPKRGDEQVLLTLADGSMIQARKTVLRSVRVGTQEIQNVECAILGPEATNAEPLLGMSFLGEFQFAIDTAAGTLEMTRVD